MFVDVVGLFFFLLSVMLTWICRVFHCFVYDVSLVFSLLSMDLALFSLLFLLLPLCVVLFVFVLLSIVLHMLSMVFLLVHLRRASGPPHFFIPCNLWDVVYTFG